MVSAQHQKVKTTMDTVKPYRLLPRPPSGEPALRIGRSRAGFGPDRLPPPAPARYASARRNRRGKGQVARSPR